ncbi:MAG: hypothetical protein GY793_07205 [Proteobacteria bacterium]|nr:hypothetical protein [Pseudomonadota bacterium]
MNEKIKAKINKSIEKKSELFKRDDIHHHVVKAEIVRLNDFIEFVEKKSYEFLSYQEAIDTYNTHILNKPVHKQVAEQYEKQNLFMSFLKRKRVHTSFMDLVGDDIFLLSNVKTWILDIHKIKTMKSLDDWKRWERLNEKWVNLLDERETL